MYTKTLVFISLKLLLVLLAELGKSKFKENKLKVSKSLRLISVRYSRKIIVL